MSDSNINSLEATNNFNIHRPDFLHLPDPDHLPRQNNLPCPDHLPRQNNLSRPNHPRQSMRHSVVNGIPV